jgi:hypothetical protein
VIVKDLFQFDAHVICVIKGPGESKEFGVYDAGDELFFGSGEEEGFNR